MEVIQVVVEMLQYLKICLFSFVLLFTSCSDDINLNQEINFSISEKKNSFIGNSGLSSELPFPPSALITEKEEFLVLNIFKNTIDTLTTSGGIIQIKNGKMISLWEGLGLDNVQFIDVNRNFMFFFTQQELFLYNLENSTTIRKKFNELNLFKKGEFTSLESKGSFFLNHFYNGHDNTNGHIYFFLKSSPSLNYKLVRYDYENDTYSEVKDFYNKELIRNHEIVFKGEGLLYKSYLPYIYFYNNQLIISYPYSNEISILNVNSEEVKNLKNKTYNFKSEKEKIKTLSADLSFFEATEIMDIWDLDVTYGNFHHLKGKKLFCRLIRGKTSIENIKNPHLFLELFTEDFLKVGEIKIGDEFSDLSTFFFTDSDKLIFKGKNQSDEDHFNHYIVEIEY
jgi:hypothetical protein